MAFFIVHKNGDLFAGGNCGMVCCLGLDTYFGIYRNNYKINILREVPLLNTLVYTTWKVNRCLGTGQDIEGFTPLWGKPRNQYFTGNRTDLCDILPTAKSLRSLSWYSARSPALTTHCLLASFICII
jgi:hypothetical protein